MVNFKVQRIEKNEVLISCGVHSCRVAHMYFQDQSERIEGCHNVILDAPIAFNKFESQILETASRHLSKEWEKEWS